MLIDGWVFFCRFFVAITVVGFVVMRDEPWFPVVLGGKGEVAKSFETLQTPPSRDLKLYFMVQLGYHVHSLVYMLVLSPIRNDFLEMLLHHVATIILIGGSFLANFTAFGALVVFTHDIGDVTGCTFALVLHFLAFSIPFPRPRRWLVAWFAPWC